MNNDQHDIVLIVDDNRDDLAMLSYALEQANLTVVTADSGETALTLTDHLIPHAIVMDGRMGGMDGFETSRRIKQNSRLAHIPILFLTGLTDTEHVLLGLAAGGVDYVTKPVIMAELVARLKVHIANARVMMGARVALDATGRHLLAVDDRGSMLWATPQASGLIAQCFGLTEAAALPADVSARLAEFLPQDAKPNTPYPLVHDGGQINATYLCSLGGREFVFRLAPPGNASDEDVLRLELGLTAREAETLAWLSKGKSNQDISQILGISTRTVDKHMERIFTKLGVENRSAATSMALKILINRAL